MLPSLSLVLLSYNEEKNIAKSISSAVAVAKKVANKYEIVVVHYSGSTDSTESIIRKFIAKNRNIRIVYQPASQKGYGVALGMGLESARYDYVFYTDADNQFDLSELPLLLPYLGSYDIVSGYRMNRQDPFGRILSSKVYSILILLLFGLGMRDIDSAFKIYKRKIFDTFKIRSVGGLVDAEILIKAKGNGFKIREIPVHHYARFAGASHYGTGFIKPSVVVNVFREIRMLWKELKK